MKYDTAKKHSDVFTLYEIASNSSRKGEVIVVVQCSSLVTISPDTKSYCC